MTDQQTPPLAERKAEREHDEPIRLTRVPSADCSALENLNALAGGYEVSLERKDEALGRTLRREVEWQEKATSLQSDRDRLLSVITRSRGHHEPEKCRAQTCDVCSAQAELDDIAEKQTGEAP